ncbi:MAG TPA: hypothetical protein ENN03_00730 [bacterium]|nr:hypothetical protein [bacterium]
MGLFRKNSAEPGSADSNPLHLPAGVPKDMRVPIMEMPYFQYTQEQLEYAHGKCVEFVSNNRDLSGIIADVWIVQKDKGSTLWIVFNSVIPGSEERRIFDLFNQFSHQKHVGFKSGLLTFAVKDPGLKVLKRMSPAGA